MTQPQAPKQKPARAERARDLKDRRLRGPAADAGARWYSIRKPATPAAAGANPAIAMAGAEVLIYGDIGHSWSDSSVLAAEFVREFAAIEASDITVRINSIGGSVPDGIAIYNALRRHPANVVTVVDGMALSIASLIAMGGDRVEMAGNAMLMIHAPWSYAAGNSVDMRETADMLDKWAEAMASSYMDQSGKSRDEIMALLTDGRDHYYTALDAQDEGFIDSVLPSSDEATIAAAFAQAANSPMAAALLAPGRGAPARLLALASAVKPPAVITAQPQAAAAAHIQEHRMTQIVNPPAATTQAATTQHSAPDASAIAAQALAQDKQRRADIRAAFAPFAQRDGVAVLQRECEENTDTTPQAAGDRLLKHLARDAAPVAGDHISKTEDEADKRMGAVVQAVMARAGVSGKDGPVRADGTNPFRGMRLLDLARASLQRGGVRTEGMDQMQLVAAAFTQGTSDFPIVLENTMHKTLQIAYMAAPFTWSRWVREGTVMDFREHPRYRVSSLSNLQTVNEHGEFKNASIPDGEKSVITADTKGYIINLTRKAIINDDLGAFVGLAQAMGRAARRTVEQDVYTLFNSNPVLEDGIPLFHADHNNIAAVNAVPTVDSFEAARVLMAQQRDVGDNDFLDLRPDVWLGPLSLGGKARAVINSTYDPDAANKLQRENIVRNLVRDIVDTPRLSGTAWYLLANRDDAPVMEVAFLDGNSTPFLEMDQGFTVDGSRWKVRLDYGVAAIDYRGAVKNNGA